MRIYVHIGTHKTGTTSIQTFLRKQSDALRDSGLYVPRTGMLEGFPGHHNIGWDLRADPRFDPRLGTFDDLLRELDRASAPAAILSSEDLEYLVDQPALLARFERDLVRAGHEPQYIAYVRRPDAYARSLYHELCKPAHGVSRSYREFINEICQTGKFVCNADWVFYFDVDAFARKWREAAAGPLAIYNYDDTLMNGDVIPSFLSVVGAPAHLVQRNGGTEWVNRSPRAHLPMLEGLLSDRRLRRRFKRPLGSAA